MRIIHVFRGAVGGLFRHVCDQVLGQAKAGHDVGILCDSLTGGESAASKLKSLTPHCSLGVKRIEMKTLPGPADLNCLFQTISMARQGNAEILHGHGAKGGLFTRLAARRLGIASVYVPHGGSLHYEWKSPQGVLFLAAEKALRVQRSGLIFVCAFERDSYAKKIGLAAIPSTVIYNGLSPDDFKPRQLSPSATDLFFVGEMRSIKGVDILLQALAAIDPRQRPSLTLVGDGPQEAEFKALANALNLDGAVIFAGRKSMAEAMTLGHTLIVPSRRESFPYVVTEAMAAGIPIIASAVGGIGEALPISCLFPVEDTNALAAKLEIGTNTRAKAMDEAVELQKVAAHRFSTTRMVAETLAFYQRLN